MALYTCTYRGTLSAGTVSEIFSHSLGIQSNAEPNVVVQALHDQWQLVWNEPATGLQNWFTPEVVYVEATAALVIDQLVPDIAAAYHSLFSPSMPGTAVGDALPTQNAVAVSLRAGVRPNGTPFRGRFYLPNLCTQFVEANGLISATQINAIGVSIQKLLDGLQAGGHTPVVWSRTVEDLVQPITEIRVGDRVDTIRSRRNALPEAYQTWPV